MDWHDIFKKRGMTQFENLEPKKKGKQIKHAFISHGSVELDLKGDDPANFVDTLTELMVQQLREEWIERIKELEAEGDNEEAAVGKKHLASLDEELAAGEGPLLKKMHNKAKSMLDFVAKKLQEIANSDDDDDDDEE